MNLRDFDIVVFDLEIKKTIGVDGVGWKSFDKMGVSVGVTYSFKKDEYKVFLDDNLLEMADILLSADMSTGFNTIDFDLELLSENIPRVKEFKQMIAKKNYDMLKHSRIAANMTGFIPGFKLDEHLEATFGREFMKTADGAQAPIFWQEKKLGKLISYCVDDVKREAALFKSFWDENTCKTQRHGMFQLKTNPQKFLMDLKTNL